MSPLSKRQNGFGHIGLLVAVLVIAAVGFVGWRVMSKDKNEDKPATSTAQNTDSPRPFGNYQGDITSKLKLQQVKLTGTGQQGVAVDEQTGLVYIGTYSGINNKCLAGSPNSGRSLLSVVDPKQAKEIAAVDTDRAPIWPAVDAKRDLVYVAASSGSVALHKRANGEKVGSINTGGLPHMPAQLGNIMVVSNTYDQSQTYYSAVNLDSRKVIGNHKGPRLPHPIVVDEQAKLAYMMGVESAEVALIDMATGQLKEKFTLEGGAGQLAMSKKYSKFVTSANQAGSSLAVYNLSDKKLQGRIGFEGANTPGTVLAIDEDSGLVFVVLGDQNAVGVASLETLKPLGFFKTGGCPYAVRVDSQAGKGYVSNSGDGTLTIFDLDALKTTL